MNFAVTLARFSRSNSSCYPRTGSCGREREGGGFHWGAGTSSKRLAGNQEPFHFPSSSQGSRNLSTCPASCRESVYGCHKLDAGNNQFLQPLFHKGLLEFKAFCSYQSCGQVKSFEKKDLKKVSFGSDENHPFLGEVLNSDSKLCKSIRTAPSFRQLFLGAKRAVALLKGDYFLLTYISSKIRK